MKSFGLFLTMMALTATLVALDLSGVHPAAPIAIATARNDASTTEATPHTSVSQPSEAKSPDDDDDEQPEPTLLNAFLVTPRPTEAVATTGTAPRPLRYD